MNVQPVSSFVAAGLLSLLGVAAVLLHRRSTVWYLFLVGLLLLAAESVLAGLAGLTLLPDRMLALQRGRLAAAAPLPVVWLLFSLVYARANPRDGLRRWAVILALAAIVPIAAAVGWFGELAVGAAIARETPSVWMVRLGPSGKVLHAVLLLAGVGVLMNLERTIRGATGTMRWRIKFMILGMGAVVAVRIHTSTQTLLYSAVHPDTDILNAAVFVLGGLLMARGLWRTGPRPLDLFVSHTVLHRSATVLLCGLYLLVVGVMAGLIERAEATVPFPVVALLLFAGMIGLGILLASDRVRLSTKRLVSRHFKRPQYDARQVWVRFAEATAGRMERDAYCRAVVRMLAETFEALSVSILLTDPARERLVLGASTCLTDHAPAIRAAVSRAGALQGRANLQALQAHDRPVDIEVSSEAWAAALRDAHPPAFPEKGGHRIAMPLLGRSALTGVLVVGDRVGGVPFTPEELELIGVIGGQTGAGLLNADLSERLLQARELEAFQTMSAFFVHDLKNTASTLSLMLDNLPRHFADPAFRDDALAAIARSAERIDNLILRLTSLRQAPLDIRREPTDLDALVRRVLAGLAGTIGPDPVFEAGGLPPVMLDAGQVEKVILNLVRNAADASQRRSPIRLATRRAEDDTVVLTVADRGCGMSQPFIDDSLFRPFSSTKKDGLGIGLYQSRMIVEAHGGTIDVTSETGQGSVFAVRLPAGNREDACNQPC